MGPQNIGQPGSDGNKAVLEELGVAYGQHRLVQIDILDGQALRFTEPEAGAMEQQEQRPQGVVVELNGARPTAVDGPEQALQFVAGEDVRWRRPWSPRLVFGRGKRRPGGVAATDRVAPEPGQRAVLVGPVPGERTLAGKEVENIGLPDGAAVDVAADLLAEPVQQGRARDEPRAVGPSPVDMGVDSIQECHARPSRSSSPTSRSVSSLTLAHAAVAETLRWPR